LWISSSSWWVFEAWSFALLAVAILVYFATVGKKTKMATARRAKLQAKELRRETALIAPVETCQSQGSPAPTHFSPAPIVCFMADFTLNGPILYKMNVISY